MKKNEYFYERLKLKFLIENSEYYRKYCKKNRVILL